jgi:hypothetical protein
MLVVDLPSILPSRVLTSKTKEITQNIVSSVLACSIVSTHTTGFRPRLCGFVLEHAPTTDEMSF